MYKVKASISNYKFNSFTQKSKSDVNWFKKEGDFYFCFNKDEAKMVEDFFLSQQNNFYDISSLLAKENELPYCSSRPIMKANRPNNLIISSNPIINTNSTIFSCMNIEILSLNGSIVNNYKLSFDLIGSIQ